MVRKVTPELDRLIAKVLRHTREFGTKVALADFLGVSPQLLNKWLRGSEPGGEVTLRLRKWVAVREAKTQQKKRAGSVEAQPALKTRKGKIKSNEKTKSDQKKY